jgi:hypothetical protein
MNDKPSDDEMNGTGKQEDGKEGMEKAARIEAMRAEKEELDLPARAKFKRESPIWKGLLRSKGQCRVMHIASSCQTSGVTLTLIFRFHLACHQK